MIPPRPLPMIWHDTKVIIEANDEVCALFRCDKQDLIDRSLLDAIARDDMRGLAKARLKVIREKGDMPPQDLPFIRHDGTRFWAKVQTKRLRNDYYATTFIYQYDY